VIICSKHIDVKWYSVYFPEIEKHLPYLLGFEFIRFSNRGVLSAASCIIVKIMLKCISSISSMNVLRLLIVLCFFYI